MESEIKNTVYIGITCMILAIVLTFVSAMTYIRNTMAEARNNEIVGREQVSKYLEVNAYDDAKLTGMELIRLITESSDKGIEVYVSGVADTAAVNNIGDNTDGMSQRYNASIQLAHPGVYRIAVDQNNGDISNSVLAKLYASTTKEASKATYTTYLVYNNEDPARAVKKNYSGNSEVTAVRVIKN